MIGVSECDDVVVPGVQPGHHGGHVVGLRTAVHQINVVQRVGKGGCKAFSVFVNLKSEAIETSIISNYKLRLLF